MGGTTVHLGACIGAAGVDRRWPLPLPPLLAHALSPLSLSQNQWQQADRQAAAVGGLMTCGPYRGPSSVDGPSSGLGDGLCFLFFKIYFHRQAIDRLRKY